MPGARLRVAEIAAAGAAIGISPEECKELLKLSITKFEDGFKSMKSTGVTEGLNILYELMKRFVSVVEETTLMKLALIYFTMNDEDPYHYIQSEQQKKVDAWDVDPDAKDFFLCRGAELTGFYGNTSDQDILMSLKKDQPNMEKATEILEKHGFVNTWMK